MPKRADLCWGKLQDGTSSYKTLSQHLKETAIVMDTLVSDSVFKERLPLLAKWCSLTEDETRRLLCFIAAMHDIGKCVPDFQCRDVARQNGVDIVKVWDTIAPSSYVAPIDHYRHEYGSKVILLEKLTAYMDYDAAEIFAAIVGLHHQRSYNPQSGFWDPFWAQMQDEIFQYFLACYHPVFPKKIKHTDMFAQTVLALVIVSDWISSSLFDVSYNPNEADTYISCKRFLKRASLDYQQLTIPETFSECWEAKPFANTPSPLQGNLAEYLENQEEGHMPSVILIEGEMGCGKTEIALFAALRMMSFFGKSGIYYALPTMATANGMYRRVEELWKYLGYKQTKLVHSQAWLYDDLSRNKQAASWLSSSRMSMLQQTGIGTIDQALSSILKIKYCVVKQLGLSSKVLVIDEVHSYDDYMLSELSRLLEYCKESKIPVVMLSGTLPVSKKRDLLTAYTKKAQNFDFSDAYPLITSIEAPSCDIVEIKCPPTYHRTYDVSYNPNMSMDQIAQTLLWKAKDGGNIVYLSNTVKRAQTVYERVMLLNQQSPDPLPQSMIHSRFTTQRRHTLENKILDLYGKDGTNRPSGSVVVSTQVLEQSLDVDFDFMITDMAPIDLILQRLGRIHRHKHKRAAGFEKPTVIVLTDRGARGGALYDAEYMADTEKVIKKVHQIKFPDDIRPLVEEVYKSYNPTLQNLRNPEMLRERYYNEMARKVSVPGIMPKPGSGWNSTFTSLRFDMEDEDEDLPSTRLAMPTVRLALIPERLKNTYDAEVAARGFPGRNTAMRIMKYCVTCPQTQFDKVDPLLTEKFTIGEGLLKDVRIIGLEEDFTPEDTVGVNSSKSKIVVDSELGLVFA